jgi:hypothetical protein
VFSPETEWRGKTKAHPDEKTGFYVGLALRSQKVNRTAHKLIPKGWKRQ